MMRSTAGFHADLAARLGALAHNADPLLTSKTPTPRRLLGAINAVDLEDVLCQINPNANKLHVTPPSYRLVAHTSSLALRCRLG
jgi:hypothetical protein